MTKNKQSFRETLQLIVDILSFETSDEVLMQNLANDNVNWDAIVIVASEHLVLPAVYCRLQQRSLLSYLPEDLVLYLEELTQLNRERNRTLLKEAEQISEVFKSHNINHVFIKGIALLAGNYYKDHGERMIGDIDILVASDDLDKAFDLLVIEGYSKFLPFSYQVQNYRHLPRQISEKHLGAIELHNQLLKHEYCHLINPDNFLSKKQNVNGISIPGPEQLIWNTILAQQINDRSYYYNTLRLKGLYDVLVVGLTKKPDIIGQLSKEKYSLGFLNLTSVVCPQLVVSEKTLSARIKKSFFILTLSSPKLRGIFFKLKSIYIGIKDRLKLIFFNKSYREHVIKNKVIK